MRLTGYKIEEEKSLEGALNFAVVNSVGAFLILIGIALIYARTGALNLAQIGRALGDQPADGLVIASFVLIVSGLAVKGAIMPFHFWLADAHAVAPSPVCVLFSGVMVELGLYGIARVYWTAYALPLETHRAAVGGIFLAVGSFSAVVGGVMCLAQRHIKRLLAFSTISHMGILLIALGLMSPLALAGASIYVVAHGLIKGALFLLAGILLDRRGTVDEYELRGQGGSLPLTGIAFVLGALGLAGVPPFATGPGKELIEHVGSVGGRGWVAIPLAPSAAMTAGAVLRVAGRVFLGWGRPEDDGDVRPQPEDERETPANDGRASLVMLTPVWALLVAAGLSSGLAIWSQPVEAAARSFMETRQYHAQILDGSREGGAITAAVGTSAAGPSLSTAVILILTLVIAALSLFSDRLPGNFRRVSRRIVDGLLGPIRALHSGKVGDYVTWLTLGVAAFGIVLGALTGVIGRR